MGIAVAQGTIFENPLTQLRSHAEEIAPFMELDGLLLLSLRARHSIY
jgi:hypothetical protein